MKVGELVRQSRQASLSPVEKKVLAYLESRSDEVFGYRDANLAKAVNLKVRLDYPYGPWPARA